MNDFSIYDRVIKPQYLANGQIISACATHGFIGIGMLNTIDINFPWAILLQPPALPWFLCIPDPSPDCIADRYDRSAIEYTLSARISPSSTMYIVVPNKAPKPPWKIIAPPRASLAAATCPSQALTLAFQHLPQPIKPPSAARGRRDPDAPPGPPRDEIHSRTKPAFLNAPRNSRGLGGLWAQQRVSKKHYRAPQSIPRCAGVGVVLDLDQRLNFASFPSANCCSFSRQT
jgi:hypothetical protein